MDFKELIQKKGKFLMEGALGEWLKRDYHLQPDERIALASLVYTRAGRAALRALWKEYAAIAGKYRLPFLAMTPTRRANRERVGAAAFPDTVNRDNLRFLQSVRQECGCEMYIGGLMGCMGDAYTGEGALHRAQALDFHSWQAKEFAAAGADFLYAGIMPALSEAVGMAGAMANSGLPYIISFTIREDGRLIDGTAIHDAITEIDRAVTVSPVCYMANCVHPRIVRQALCQPFNRTDTVRRRFLGLQANTSPLPYQELDGAAELHASPPEAFAEEMMALHAVHPLRIFGGCCGTDGRHIECVARLLCGPAVLAAGDVP